MYNYLNFEDALTSVQSAIRKVSVESELLYRTRDLCQLKKK